MILVVVEPSGAAPDGLSLEAVSFAHEAGAAAGIPVEVVSIPRDAEPPAGRAAALCRLIERRNPIAVIGPGSDTGSELLAHVAARLGLPMAANCVSLELGAPGQPARLTRQRWGGTLLEDATLHAATVLVTVAPHAVRADAPTGTEPIVMPLAIEDADRDKRVRFVERVPLGRQGMALEDAPVVVGGGRGVGSAEAFALLDELAGLLGGTVGVSRAVTSAGWRSHEEQIGQTGARIAPELYVACGISGAVQHIVGCRGAKRILAINTDPDAPMVTAADWAVIGDLHAILPPLIAELRALRRP